METGKFTAEMAKQVTLESMNNGKDEELNMVLAMIKEACECRPPKSCIETALSFDIITKLRHLGYYVDASGYNPKNYIYAKTVISWL